MDSTTPLLRSTEDFADHSSSISDEMAIQESTKGKLRAYWLGAVVCMGGFLFGYDSGMYVPLLSNNDSSWSR